MYHPKMKIAVMGNFSLHVFSVFLILHRKYIQTLKLGKKNNKLAESIQPNGCVFLLLHADISESWQHHFICTLSNQNVYMFDSNKMPLVAKLLLLC